MVVREVNTSLLCSRRNASPPPPTMDEGAGGGVYDPKRRLQRRLGQYRNVVVSCRCSRCWLVYPSRCNQDSFTGDLFAKLIIKCPANPKRLNKKSCIILAEISDICCNRKIRSILKCVANCRVYSSKERARYAHARKIRALAQDSRTRKFRRKREAAKASGSSFVHLKRV